MTLPRLLILSFSDISADARVLKQVTYFASRYDVTTYGYGPSPDPRVRHLQLDDASDIRRWSRSELILRRFRRMYWEQPGIKQALADLAGLEAFDAILANDVDTVGLALALKPKKGVHADIHEYAPRQNDEVLVWRVFIAPFVRWMCRTFLTAATSMTTLGQGIAEEYLRAYGLHAGVVTNAAPYVELTVRPTGAPIRLVHSGASLRNRKLEVLVDAAKATTTDVTLDLYLMGNDPNYVDELRERSLGSDRIHVLDPLPYHQLIGRLNEYDVGIPLIPPANFNYLWTLPNKFFDYVQARLGVIIGPSPEMRSLLHAYDLGLSADDFGAAALTRVLDSLTVEQVDTWKAHAEAAARALSSEAQVEVWGAAIDALMNRARP